MLKNISNLGKTLNKAEQKTIKGGLLDYLEQFEGCGYGTCKNDFGRCSKLACDWNDEI